MFEGYLALGGNEIVNSARTSGYMSSGDCPINWIVCPPCDGLVDANGDLAYTMENIEDAPWYDVEEEPSHRFLGVHALGIEGLNDSTREASIAEGTADGGVVGNVRHAVRQVRVRALLSAYGEDALESGLGWLKAALDPDFCGTHGTSCGATDSCFYTACPPSRASITKPEVFWNTPITNMATNPSMETASAATVVHTNQFTNPSFEKLGSPTAVRTNLVTNPSFEATTAATVEVRRNLANNPSWESGGGVVTVRTNRFTNPSFETVAGTTEVRRNLIGNPSFETDVSGVNVGNGNPPLPTRSTAEKWAGTASLYYDPGPTAAADKGPQVTVGGLTVGLKYTFSAYVKQTALFTPQGLRIGHYDGAWNGTSAWVTTVGEWTRVSITFTATSVNGGVIVIGSPNTGNNLGAPFYLDAMLLENTPILHPYFDGSTLPVGDFLHAWSGTPSNSQSVEYANAVAGIGAYESVPYQSSEWASSGTKSLAIRANGRNQDSIADVGAILSPVFDAGGTFTVMGKLRLPVALTTPHQDYFGRLRINASTAPQTTIISQPPNAPGVWEYREVFTVDPHSAQAFFLYNGSGVEGETVWWDDFAVVEGNYTGPYFDGSTPAKVRRNLALTPSCPVDNWPPNGWNLAAQWAGGGTWANDTIKGGQATTVPGTTLTTCVRKTWTAVGTSAPIDFSFSQCLGTRMPVTPGEVLTVSFWVRASWAQGVPSQNKMRAEFYDSLTGGNLVATLDGPILATLVPNVWTRYSYTVTAPPGVTHIYVYHLYDADQSPAFWPVVGSTLDATGLLVERSSTLGAYFDGSTPADSLGAGWEGTPNASPSYLYDSDFTYAWDGTANASTSQQRGDFVAACDSANQGYSLAALTRSTQWHSDRTRSLRIIPVGNTGANSGNDTGATVAGGAGGMSGYGVTFTAGQTYTVSARIRLTAPQTGDLNPRARRIHFADSVRGWEDYSAMSVVAPNAAGETRLSLTFTVSAGATWAILRLYNGAGGGGGDVWWDDLIITSGNAVTPYFDGSTVPISPDLPHAWTGTADLSASVEYGTAVPTVSNNNAAGIQSTEWASSGTKSLRVTRINSSDAFVEMNYPASANTQYTALLTTRVIAPTMVPGSAITDQTYGFQGPTFWPAGTVLTGVQQWRVTVVLPATSTAIKFILRTLDTVGGSVWYDDILLVQGAYTGPYFDGSNPAKVRRNLVRDPSALGQDSFAFWAGPTGSSTQTNENVTWSVNKKAYRATWYGTEGVETPGVMSSGIGLTPGQTYTVEWDMVTPFPATVHVGFGGSDPAGWVMGANSGSATTVAGVPTHFWMTFTAGTGVNARALAMCDTARPSDGWAEVSNASIYPGTKASGYTFFDGSTPANVNGIAPYVGAWEGAANASPSYLKDPDFTYAWSGSPNQSASYQSIVGPWKTSGNSSPDSLTVVGSSVAWASTRTRSARIIALGAQNDSFVSPGFDKGSLRMGMLAGHTYTASATLHILSPQTGTLHARARRIVAFTNAPIVETTSEQPPNTPGDYRLSVTFTVPSGATEAYVRLYNGGAAPSPDVWWDSFMLVEGTYAGAYFDGTGSTSSDSDFTYAWTGAVDDSTSTQSVVGVAGIAVNASAATNIQSPVWASNRYKSLRIVPTQADANDSFASPGGDVGGMHLGLQAGKTYTVSAVLHLAAPQTGSMHTRARRIAFFEYTDAHHDITSAQAPNVVGDHPLRLTFTVSPNATQAFIRLYNGAVSGGGDVWWDSFMLVEGVYDGPYFDGWTPDSPPEDYGVIGKNLAVYDWTGTPDASASTYQPGEVIAVEDPDTWQTITDSMVRSLHNVTCISGPLIEQKLHRGDMWGYIVEFTLAAGTPWLFGLTKPVVIQPSLPIVVQDTPFNLLPYPSAEIESGTVVVATNYSTNPSVEVNATGWAVNAGDGISVANVVGARSTELASGGSTASFKTTFTAPGAGTNGYIGSEQVVDLPGITPTTRYSVNIWATSSVQSGTAVVGNIDFYVYWRNAANAILRNDSLGSLPAAGGAVSKSALLPPAGTTNALVRVIARVPSYSAGAVVRVYADTLAVTNP